VIARPAAALALIAALVTGACGGEDPAASPPPAASPSPHGVMPPAPTAAPTRPPVTWTVPQGWKEGRPSSSMRLAQFDVAADAGGSPVQCIVFGGEMGDDEQNVARWIGQMGPDAKAGATIAKSEQGALKITRVAAKGPYTDAMRPGDAKSIADASLLAAIVESTAGKLYVKLVGPRAQVEAAAKQFDEFIASMR
jgi:hypothetical protein